MSVASVASPNGKFPIVCENPPLYASITLLIRSAIRGAHLIILLASVSLTEARDESLDESSLSTWLEMCKSLLELDVSCHDVRSHIPTAGLCPFYQSRV